MGYGNLTKKERDIVRKIRESVPRVTCTYSGIRWWEFWLWKYRKFEVPCIGLKNAIDLVVMIRNELKKTGQC